jgi:hypothetical protein
MPDRTPTPARIEVTWFKTISAAVISAIGVAAVIWGAIEVRGNEVWAPKQATAAALTRLSDAAIESRARAEIHYDNEDVHMSAEAKRRAFVTRAEWDAGREQTNRDVLEVKALLTEQRSDIKLLLQQTK